MRHKLTPFTQEHIKPALELFRTNYRQAQQDNPLLPARVLDDPDWIHDNLKMLSANPGVAVIDGPKLIAYMLSGLTFPFKGQNAVMMPVFSHAAVTEDKRELYRMMYMELAGGWAEKGQYLHIFSHLSCDSALRDTLFELGFGAFLAERVRDLSPVVAENDIKITEEPDYMKLVDLDTEHMKYYPASPIFIKKDTDRPSRLAELKAHAEAGDSFLVYYQGGKPAAYFTVGESARLGEGFLLQKTNTGQIKSAFVQPGVRSKGVGTALLQYTVAWAKKRNYERLFVEHETANYYGGYFWGKYFQPYLYFSLRYIDNTLGQ